MEYGPVRTRLLAVPPEETASAAGIQNFVRTLAIGVATALVLSIQGNTQQEARSEIVSHLQPADTMARLTGAGFDPIGATQMITGLVDREATTLAVDHVFLIVGVLGDDAMHAPHHRELSARRDIGRDADDERAGPLTRDAQRRRT